MVRTASLMAATLAALYLCLSPAHAQNGTSNRAWVSGHGTDASGCGGTTNPCRSFQYVLDNVVAPNGEIDVLDPAGYGAMTISHGVSIINDGAGTAGIQVAPSGPPAGTAITINASASDVVTLRGLTINGPGTLAVPGGLAGIALYSGGSLIVTKCAIQGFMTGIVFAPGSPTTAQFGVYNSSIMENGTGISLSPPPFSSSAVAAIMIPPPPIQSSFSAAIANSVVSHNGYGVIVNETSVASSVEIDSNKIFSNVDGVDTTSNVGRAYTANVILRNNALSGNSGYDVYNNVAGGNGSLYLFNGNNIGFINNSGDVLSDGTNNVISLTGNQFSAASRM